MNIYNTVLNFCKFSILILLIFTYKYASSVFYPAIEYSEYVHHTLLIDRSFTQEETDNIVEAAFEWSTATNHRASFDIVYLPNTQEILDKDCILIVKVTPDYPDILLYDLESHNEALGLYINYRTITTIELVTSRINDLRSVALHELGHALGLKHNKGIEGVNTLMYPSIDLGSDHITKIDLQSFCNLHHCDINKL